MSIFGKDFNVWMKMIDESEYDCIDENQLLTEGKHWPQDYERTFAQQIKNSPLYSSLYQKIDNDITTDVQNIIKDVDPLAYSDDEHIRNTHRVDNRLISYFSTFCRWFMDKAMQGPQQYGQFMTQLPDIVQRLKLLGKDEERANREKLKSGTFEEFMKFTDDAFRRAEEEDAKKLDSLNASENGYSLIKIDSFSQLENLFGGMKTGAAQGGTSGWCHTNDLPTYNRWTTTNGPNQFVILVKDGWQQTLPQPQNNNAFDDYGKSAIAMLVNLNTGRLLKSTTRYNHVVPPPNGNVDYAFNGYGDLSTIAGFDVKKAVLRLLGIEGNDIDKMSDFAKKHYDGANIVCDNGSIEKNLVGSPKQIQGDLRLYKSTIMSLEGSPEKIGGDFICREVDGLKTLDHSPIEVDGDFLIYDTDIKSLNGAPTGVGGNVYILGTLIPQYAIKQYKKFLKHQTPEHIDQTGHYMQ